MTVKPQLVLDLAGVLVSNFSYKHVEQFFELDKDAKPTVLYVDDQEKNLKPAVELGWGILLADKENKWIDKVEPIISSVTFPHILGGELR